MKKLQIYFSLVALTSVLFLANCKKKHDTPAPTNTTTPTCYMLNDTLNGAVENDFTFDNNNRVTKVYYHNPTPSASTYFTFQYNGNGVRTKATLYDVNGIPLSYSSYIYDSGGRLVTDSIYVNNNYPISPASYAVDSITTFQYNSSGQIIRRDDKGITSGLTSYATYTRDANNNILTEMDYNGGVIHETITSTYDDKISYGTYYSTLYPEYAQGKNNTLTETHKDGSGTTINSSSFTAIYTYNSNNYPVKEKDTYLDSHVDNFVFVYNCK
jgi:hypothetical protein